MDTGAVMTTGQADVNANVQPTINTYGVNWNAQTIPDYVNGNVDGLPPTAIQTARRRSPLNSGVGSTAWAWEPGIRIHEHGMATRS